MSEVLKALGDLAKEIKHIELGTFAGLVNLAGFAALIRLAPSVGVIEPASERLALLIEGSRKYRALKRGETYEPVIKRRRPKPDDTKLWKVVLMVVGYVLLCVAVVAVVGRVVAPV